MPESILQPVLIVAVLIVSVVIHENAHGWTALALGDQTAHASGRLTLNPLRHLDPIGSVIMPAFLAFTAGMAFGYAKPVPVDPRKLRGGDKGFALVALAGPASNLAIAFATLVAWRSLGAGHDGRLADSLAFVAIQLNIFLAAFNLLPIPPLDGSRLLRLVLRPGGVHLLERVEPYGFLILLAMLVLMPDPLMRAVDLIASVLARVLPA